MQHCWPHCFSASRGNSSVQTSCTSIPSMHQGPALIKLWIRGADVVQPVKWHQVYWCSQRLSIDFCLGENTLILLQEKDTQDFSVCRQQMRHLNGFAVQASLAIYVRLIAFLVSANRRSWRWQTKNTMWPWMISEKTTEWMLQFPELSLFDIHLDPKMALLPAFMWQIWSVAVSLWLCDCHLIVG